MPGIPDASVHLVLCDLPYNVTDCRWDRLIDSAALFREYSRVVASGGAVLLFAQGAFIGRLMAAAPRGWFRYEWIWDKRGASGWLNANRMPLRAHESVLVFGQKLRYFPQGLRAIRPRRKGRTITEVYGEHGTSVQTLSGYPTTLLRFKRETGAKPCQKPVELLEYLIRTYTLEGETVLDNAMGLGSTGVAAARAGRRFLGIEIDADRFAEARRRIEAAEADRRG